MSEKKSSGTGKPLGKAGTSGRAGTGKPAPPGLQEHIGSQLKAMYDEVVAQPIPDRLLELLNRLDEKAGDK